MVVFVIVFAFAGVFVDLLVSRIVVDGPGDDSTLKRVWATKLLL